MAKVYRIFLLLLISSINGLLFAIPFIWDSFFFLIFIAFVPLFFVSKYLKTIESLLYSFVCVATWFFCTLHWLHSYNISVEWSVLAIIILVSITFIPFCLYFYGINKIPVRKEYKYMFFILLWILVEWLSCEWELSFSFHILGYCLGSVPLITQWYQYTGVMGGSIWILWTNFMFLYIIDSIKERKKHKIWAYSIIAAIPLCVSFLIYLTPVAVQHTEKVCALNMSDKDTLHKRIPLINAIDYLSTAPFDSTDAFIVLPESICYLPASAVPYNVYFSTIELLLKQRAPQTSIIFGASTQDLSKGASFNNVDFFNMVLCCDTSGLTNYRNKMLLAPFGEFIPYKVLFGKIPGVEKIIHNSILYDRKYDTIFCKRNMYILPLICYELYFSNHIANYIRKNKVEIIITVSNDNCVKDSLFTQQFVRMAQVQAVTFAKPIVKSAMHGFSFIISPKGKILSKSHFNSVEFIEAIIPLNNKVTLFARIGNTAVFLYWIVLFLIMIITGHNEVSILQRESKDIK